MGLGLVMAYLNNRDLTDRISQLSSQNQWFRRELGIEVSKDPKVLCAQEIDDDIVDLNDVQWKWMVNVPKRGRYELRFATELLPAIGYPKQFIGLPIKSGVNEVSLFFSFDYERNQWMENVLISSRDKSESLDQHESVYFGELWMETLDRAGQVGGIVDETRGMPKIEFAKKGESFLLKQFVWHKPKKGSSRGTLIRTGDGYMIWIEEVE